MAFLSWHRVQLALYCSAGSLSLLLLIGINNALDVAVSVTVQKRRADDKKPSVHGKEQTGSGARSVAAEQPLSSW
jgi:hypothetical protein